MFTVKAEGVGEDSMVGQMITIMEKALGQKTPFEGKTDRALQWFVPLIICLAVGTGVACLLAGLSFNEAIIRAVTVTVISCPCALGIAIPVARVAGISLAGRKGVLVRDSTSFEHADRMAVFVLDKTGTVTKGQWSLLDILPIGSLAKQEILGLAASLEQGSDHLVADAVRQEATRSQAPLVSLDQVEILENGISAKLNGDEIKIGSRSFMSTELEASPTVLLPKDMAEQSLVFMSLAGQICSVLVFGDEIRPTAAQAVQQLHEAGYRLALISGDAHSTTKAIAREVGIEEALGGMLPHKKAAFIADLQDRGLQVAMVGDGINDAPALIQADLAIAVHSGSNLGKEAADLTLMRGDPLQICDFVELASKVKKKIHQNLGFSFVYNAVSIPVAMSGLLNPLIAVTAMLMSSLSVIGNTLLLLKKS
jgi:heavy metal translocating P-type ATPase